MPVLRIVETDKSESQLDLSGTEYTIGREPGNSIVLQDQGVSRYHAMIVRRDDGYYVVDKKSSNGTFLNNQKVIEAMLSDGDVITIGGTSMFFQAGQATQGATVVFNEQGLRQNVLDAQKCPGCGGTIPLGAEFCHHCGSPISVSGASPATIQAKPESAWPMVTVALAVVLVFGMLAAAWFYFARNPVFAKQSRQIEPAKREQKVVEAPVVRKPSAASPNHATLASPTPTTQPAESAAPPIPATVSQVSEPKQLPEAERRKILREMGLYSGTVSLYEAQMAKDPASKDRFQPEINKCYYDLGVFSMQLSQCSQAGVYFNKVLASDQNDQSARDALALARLCQSVGETNPEVQRTVLNLHIRQ